MNRTESRKSKIDRISVRNLVEFILRSGDIDNRTGARADREAMQMGSRLHRKIQGRMGGDYQAEVPLSGEFPCGDFVILVEGRADGIIRKMSNTQDEDEVTIDEIKGVYRNLEYLTEPVPVHLAQAKCYAFFYADQNHLSRIGVRMSYGNLETEEMKYFHYSYEYEELKAWFFDVLEEYKKWAVYAEEHRKIRRESIHRTTFPFEYREGQLALMSDVYRTIWHKKALFIQAPTGVGKTLSTLFPAVKAVGEEKGDKIFYLTAKTSAAMVAARAADQLREAGLRAKYVVLTAKDKICFGDVPECDPEHCPYAKGHFDRINDAVFSLLTQSGQEGFTREAVEEAAKTFRVCPFELSLDLSEWVDLIIGDYNYVFHPRSRLRRYFGDGVRGDYLFLIDEAHNLVERGRDMFSASLVKEDFLEVKRAVKEIRPGLARALERCNRVLLEKKRECETYCCLESLGSLPILLMNLSGEMEEFLDDIRSGKVSPDKFSRTDTAELVRDLYFRVLTFLDICDRMDERYVLYDELRNDGSFMLKLFCVDPSQNLQECLDKARSSIFFSATLLPVSYYMQLLSTREDNFNIYAHSCFDSANRRILIGTDTSTRYKRRGAQEYRRMASYIRAMAEAKKGNYMVFFPSYRMLEEVEQEFRPLLEEHSAEKWELICQHSGMKEEEREEFLEAFSRDREHTLIGFCVMGSIFAEGIDLTSDRLIGAVIVGAALPQVNTEQDILRNYFDGKDRDGFSFAYLCPGMNKVLQAAGRVIRTEEDTGVILMLDERFALTGYRQMFPPEWQDARYCTLRTVSLELEEFWKSFP